MHFENNGPTTSIEDFRQATAMINLVIVTQFFEAVYTEIFKRFLAIWSIKNGF